MNTSSYRQCQNGHHRTSMMWLNYLLLLIAIQTATGQQKFVSHWPIQVGERFEVYCWMKNLGGIKNLPDIDPLEIVTRVTLKVGDGLVNATYYDPKPNRNDSNYITFERKIENITRGFRYKDFGMGFQAIPMFVNNARNIYIKLTIEKAQCHHVTDYTCSFEYFTNYSEKRSAIQSFSMETKKFKAKTSISPNPVILGRPMTVTCSDSANNDDLNVTIVNISLFIKHEGSFKRLFTYNTDESIKYGQFQLPGVTKNSFNVSVNKTNGNPRYSMMMKIDSAMMEHVAINKCQYDVIMQNGCTKTEEFLVDETADCSDICGIHNCEVKEGVATCLCLHGYEKSGPLQCNDINECKKHHDICLSHKCVNANGSYSCECRHGYHNIIPQICVEDNKFDTPSLAQQKSSFFQLKSIEAKVVSLGLGYITVGFFIATVFLFANTVWASISRFAKTEPVDGITVRGTLFHYLVITKYVEEIKDDIEKSIEQSVLSAKENDSISDSVDHSDMIVYSFL